MEKLHNHHGLANDKSCVHTSMLSLLEEPERERGRRARMRRDMKKSGIESMREERVNSREDVDVFFFFAVIQKKNTIIPSSRSAGEAG